MPVRIASVLALFFVTPAFAQLPAPIPDVEAAGGEIQQLTQLIRQLTSSIARVTGTVEQQGLQISDIKADLGELATLRREVRELSDTVRELRAEQQAALAGGAGSSLRRISSIMAEDEAFREDFGNSVNDVLRSEGSVTVSNKTSTSQNIQINGRTETIRSGAVRTFKVPVGTLRTQMPGESAVHWTISPPTYSEAIDIVPLTTAQRPQSNPLNGTSTTPVTTTLLPVTSAPVLAYSPVTYTSYSPVAYTSYSPVAYTSYSPVAYTSYSPVAYTSYSPVTYTSYSPVVDSYSSYYSPTYYYSYRPGLFGWRWRRGF